MFLVTVLVLIVQLNPTILCVGYSYSYLADNCRMCFGYWFKFLLKLYPLYTCIIGLILLSF